MSWLGDQFFGGAEKKAAQRQMDAARGAQLAAEQRDREIQATYQPYLDSGTNALGAESTLLGTDGSDPAAQLEALRNSPGYEFQRQEGDRAISGNSSAAGMLGSGNRLKALTQFGQGLADQTYNTRVNQLGDVANRGLSATNSAGSSRRSLGAQIDGYGMDIGSYDASRFMGKKNAINNTLSEGAKFAGQMATGYATGGGGGSTPGGGSSNIQWNRPGYVDPRRGY